MEQAPSNNEASSGTSALSAGLEMPLQPLQQAQHDMADAVARLAATAEKPSVPDEVVWMNIYCAVANCFNSEKSTAVSWADEGVREFRKRFRL